MNEKTEVDEKRLTKQELQLEEYKLLQSMINSESSLFWTRFNILFAVEIFLFGVFAFILKELFVTKADESIFLDVDIWIINVLVSLWIIIGYGTTILWYTVMEKNSGFISFILKRLLSVETDLVHIKKQTFYYKKYSRSHHFYYDYLVVAAIIILPYDNR